MPGDLILHTCHGYARKWLPAGAADHCTCGAPLAGDLKPIKGHAMFLCRVCLRWIGVCASQELEQVADGAHRLLLAEDRNKRKGTG